MAAIKDLFPNLLFMPTGGVDPTAESIGTWFKAGVCAVGMGSKLVTQTIMQNNDYAALTAETKKIRSIINDCKK